MGRTGDSSKHFLVCICVWSGECVNKASDSPQILANNHPQVKQGHGYKTCLDGQGESSISFEEARLLKITLGF